MWEDIPRVPGGWRTILVDPPWPYDQKLTGRKTRGGAEKHYRTLSIKEIMTLPIPDLVARDAMVWLWTMNTHIPFAFPILEVWDLKYKVMATWTKKRFGLGYWLRGKTEHLLLGVRGNPRVRYEGPHGAMGSPWSTLVEELAPDDALLLWGKWRGHSVKPWSSYEMIEAIGETPRLELFARETRKGWTVWGEEVE